MVTKTGVQTVIFMLRHYQPPNPFVMTIAEQRSLVPELLDRVDDEFFSTVYAMLETYVRKQSARKYDLFDFSAEAYEESLSRPMTQAELVARAEASNADIAAGRTHSMEEVKAELGL